MGLVGQRVNGGKACAESPWVGFDTDIGVLLSGLLCFQRRRGAVDEERRRGIC